jgi:hypothetical protein
LVDTRGHASYARGALTALIAIAAYFLSFWASAMITTKGAAAREFNAQAGVREPAGDEGAAADAADDAVDGEAADNAADGETADAAGGETENADDEAANDPPAPAPAATQRRLDQGARLIGQRPPERSPWEYLALGAAALIAYQLGRGSEGPRTYASDGTVVRDEPAPVSPGQFPPSD